MDAHKAKVQTLREFGLRFDVETDSWYSEGLVLGAEQVEELELWELDMVLAAARDGRDSVQVKGGVWNFKDEDD